MFIQSYYPWLGFSLCQIELKQKTFTCKNLDLLLGEWIITNLIIYRFFIEDFFSKYDQIHIFFADLVIFTEEHLNEKFHFKKP